jgi:hypothetical protein
MSLHKPQHFFKQLISQESAYKFRAAQNQAKQNIATHLHNAGETASCFSSAFFCFVYK